MTQNTRSFRACLSSIVHRPHGYSVRQPGILYRALPSVYYSTSPSTNVDAVVLGSGPGGITAVGNLLDHGRRDVLWVDPQFQGGRINARYREVPSNTKVRLFLEYANSVAAFRHIIENTPKPNAVTALQDLPSGQGCSLHYAADMCLMLTKGLSRYPGVRQWSGNVTSAVLNEKDKLWRIGLEGGETATTSHLVLCTGSSPNSRPLPVLQKLAFPDLRMVDLDVALKPSVLSKTLDPASSVTVAVIGASHSAILVLMNLVKLASTSHPGLRIKWFTRNKLRYAEQMDGWILRDNTGLKGEAAEWAKKNLDEDTFDTGPVSQVISKHWTLAGKEDDVYESQLPGCTHFVQAVGYDPNPIPSMSSTETERPLKVEFDNDSGRFFNKTNADGQKIPRQYVPGLFGIGIAFPERVTDPYGNVELAVGFYKFMKFAKRVVPEWLAKP